MAITVRDEEEWYFHPVTQQHLQRLRDAKQALLEQWGMHNFISESGEQTLQMNAKALGEVYMLTEMIETIESAKPQELTKNNPEGE